MFASHWFVTLFCYALPPAHLVRVWDVFLLDGHKMIFRTALALLKSAQDSLLPLNFEQTLMTLNQGEYPILEESPSVLIKAACCISVTRRLEEARIEFEKAGV